MISLKYLPNITIFRMQDDPRLRRWCTLEDDSGDRKGFWKLLPPDVRSFEESYITSSLPEHAVFFLSGDNFDSCLVISFIQGRRNVKWDRDRGSFQYLSTQRLLKIEDTSDQITWFRISKYLLNGMCSKLQNVLKSMVISKPVLNCLRQKKIIKLWLWIEK